MSCPQLNMHLASIEITNLRAFKKETIFLHNYTCIVGPNNCGKSAVLRAIEIFLDQQKPSPEEWNKDAGNEDIIIEGLFKDVTDDERKIPGIAGLVFNGEIRLKTTFKRDEKGDVQSSFEAFVQEESITGWTDSFKTLSPDIQALAASAQIGAADFRNKGGKEKLREAVRKGRPDLVVKGDANWTDEGISIPEAFKQGLPRVFIIPAVKDARDEAKLTQRKNYFADILKKDVLPELEGAKEYSDIRLLSQALRQSLPNYANVAKATSSISNQACEVLPLSVSLTFDIPELQELISSTARFLISDGKCETPISLQGHGAQRSLIYAIYVHYANRKPADDNSSRPVVLLFEEPELYIHPHVLRKLKESLVKLGQKVGWQVVVTSHSPIMVDVADRPESLVILRRDENGMVCKRQLDHDPFEVDGKQDERKILRALLDFHPTVCEAFFADDTVLVEGDSEVAILRLASKIFESLGEGKRNTYSTTVVSCDGKWTILPIARLLKDLGISFRVIHDLDEEQADVDGKENGGPAKANPEIELIAGKERVFQVSDTLEDLLYVDKKVRYKSDKPFRARQRIIKIIESGEIKKHARLLELFEFVFPKAKK